ncbi:MAG: HAD family hydrolase [Clostridiales bacterium]|nr:HAD family hydrolase [Candidatus Blautia equi]
MIGIVYTVGSSIFVISGIQNNLRTEEGLVFAEMEERFGKAERLCRSLEENADVQDYLRRNFETKSERYSLELKAGGDLFSRVRDDEWQHGILKYFDFVVASAEEGVAKPDKKIFEIALERANCKPENAVMIGDRVDNDIVPAKKMGMKTIWIKQGFGKYWQIRGEYEQADCVVNNLNEIIEILM